MSNRNSDIRILMKTSLEEAGYRLRRIEKLRSNVFIVQTDNGKFLVKGFGSNKRLQSQASLTRNLFRNGFDETYRFIDEIPAFKYGGDTYAFIEYLSGSSRSFTYDSFSERMEGLDLLEKFHKATSKFYKSLPVSTFDQVRKWEERLDEFQGNLPLIRKYMPEDFAKSWVQWGKVSLKGLKRNEREFYDERQCIVHGDVADHNFFRKKSGSLYLIDFDLIAKSPPITDYLQYANRIMPHISGSRSLFAHDQINRYKRNKGFMYALTYPTDIFREWNRLARDDEFSQGSLHPVWKLSVENAKRRFRLYEDISSMR